MLIVLTAVYATALDVAVVSVYVAGLLAMLVLSATYNLWPVSRAKWVLRRFDHSAIYRSDRGDLHAVHHGVEGEHVCRWRCWSGSGAWRSSGIVLKLIWPGRFDRLSVGLYLAMGWSGLMLYDRVVTALPDRGARGSWLRAARSTVSA